MPNQELHIERMVGDRLTGIAATLVQNGSPVNLTGKTVVFRMVKANNDVKIAAGVATIVSAANGQVSYEFTADDVDTAGVYYAWWIVTGSGKPDHFPHDGRKYKITLISESL